MAAAGFALHCLACQDRLAQALAFRHQLVRDDQGPHAETDDVDPPVAEQLLKAMVAVDHVAAVVDDDDGLG